MRKKYSNPHGPGLKKVACTVSAAALMLGVSPAATVGMHFMENYCGSAAYSGFPVTLSAFGIAPSGWQNLTAMDTGYLSCAISAPPFGYTLNEVIDTTTSTNGLNPLAQGSLNVTWFGPTANFSGFSGYGGKPPHYSFDGPPPNPIPTGAGQIYATFIRDGVNFGPPGGADNTSGVGGYSVDITGLKSVFTGPFVVQLIAASDSMQALTNAFVVDATTSTTNSVSYPSTPTVTDEGGTGGRWVRGHGGGLSTASDPLNTDHIQIMSNLPQHGGTGVPPSGFDNAGTISGFIITDKPVVTMPPQPVTAFAGDTIILSAYAIGVPPLAYQWRLNGKAIAGATNLTFTIPTLSFSQEGNYDLVVTNTFGSATSDVAAVNGSSLTMTSGNNIVVDSNPANTPRDGTDLGATWLASSSDGTTSRSGVMQFVGTNVDKIIVSGTSNFDTATGTVMFWMRSAGTDPNTKGNIAAALYGRPTGTNNNNFLISQGDGGNIFVAVPNNGGTANNLFSQGGISDNNWHLIAVTFDQSDVGGLALYIDGVLDSTNANSASWAWPTGKQIEMGFSSDPSWRAYDGLLDDVRFYSRQLTAGEVASVFSSAAVIDTAKLQMRLNFDAAPGLGFTLSWPTPSSVLQSAPSAQGPYTNEPAALSPFVGTFNGSQKYFRFNYPPHTPQVIVSNPFLM